MNKQKSIIVTVIMALMLAVTLFSAWKLSGPMFAALASLLGAYGFLCGAANFCRWLGRETPLLPAQTTKDEAWEADEEFQTTYDQIKQEVMEGRL